jgi:hypothetical protein
MDRAVLPEAIGEALDEEAIEQVIRVDRASAAEALARMRVGRESRVPSAEGLDAAADLVGEDRAAFWVATLKRKDCLATFVSALRTRGLAVASWTLGFNESMWDPPKLTAFLARADVFRCKVRVNGAVKGSGVLVGPSSALTAWHVTAVAAPGAEQKPVPRIEVELADGRKIDAVVTAASSPCGDVEYPPGGGRAPRSDAEVEGRHDVALLRLKQPAGIHLSFAALASPAYDYAGPAAIVLISYPEGAWHGVEFAKLRRLRKLTARWGYDVQGNRGGSSGGGCFDTRFRLAGIHQGRSSAGGRLVPLICFDGIVRNAIADDETPAKLWSLDGTPDSGLVVGRDAFFSGYHAAMRGPARARGLWVRRVDLKHDLSGLPFSYEMLDKLVARSPDTRLARVSFDAVVHDMPAEIARRAAEAGVEIDAPAARSGVGIDETEPEAVVADRSRALAQALDGKARQLGVTLWMFFDHPAVVFGDEPRWALTAFVDQALRLGSLRIALAGYEAVQMPGDQFESRFDAEGSGAPGLMVEYLTDVGDVDVRNLIVAAAADMGRAISRERVDEWTAEALAGLQRVNRRYDSGLRSTIAARLQARLRQLREEGAPA